MRPLRMLAGGWLTAVALAAGAFGAGAYFEGWDAGSLAGWTPNTAVTTVEVRNTGGNPGGYLCTHSDNAYGSMDIGAKSLLPQVTGDYIAAGICRASFEIILISGNFDNGWFRVRGSEGTWNGWCMPLPGPRPLGVWIADTIWFDPAWTDAEAAAAGWVQEGYSLSFSQTMSNAHPEVRISGEGPLEAGIDNFRLDTLVPSGVSVDIMPG